MEIAISLRSPLIATRRDGKLSSTHLGPTIIRKALRNSSQLKQILSLRYDAGDVVLWASVNGVFTV